MNYCSFSNFSLSPKERVIHLARVNSEKQVHALHWFFHSKRSSSVYFLSGDWATMRPQRCYSSVPPLKELNVQGWAVGEKCTDGEKGGHDSGKKTESEGRDKDQGAHISCLAGIWVKNKRTLLKWNRVRQEAAIFRGPREHSVFFPFSLNSIV